MIIANRYSNFELTPYVCGAHLIKWMNPEGEFMSDVDLYFKKKYKNSWRLLEIRTLNFLFLIGTIDFDSERKMLRLAK